MLQNSRKILAIGLVCLLVAIAANFQFVETAVSQGIQTVKILSGSLTADTELPAPAALADATANPTLTGIATYNMCFNGTTWDRCEGGTKDTDDNSVAFSQVPHLALTLQYLSNGTNWARLLSAANALNSTGGGLATAQIIGQFDDTSPTSITENQFGNLRMSANRNLFATLRDAAGNERGLNIDTNGEIGIGAIRNALPAGSNAIGKLSANSGVDIGDVDVTSLPSVTIGTFPDNEPFNQNQRGGTAIVAGRCEREEPLYINISQTGNTQLITGTASERIYICSFHLVTATAQNVALVDGTGTVCATGTAGVEGFSGTTAATGWNFAANGGIVLPMTHSSYGRTTTNADNVCLFQSGAGQVSGGLSYVSIAP